MSWNLYFLLYFHYVLDRLGHLGQKGKPAVAATGLWSGTALPDLTRESNSWYLSSCSTSPKI